ncbi:MAG TPA: chromosomal replication initiator protein DnaA [bacterium]|uniref:Chromosomal replication initiator protein DnaA n=1 Tax=candidate division TA06 bacterium ADurb.Bin417 TaxID=1852828 RepID=A0A1V5MM70_UNCT6|nr:MAG: Chromosomal replication initiator protein DnaA [candidate division TA06 bacterium ADurb.Bin417]HNS48739.1 chromosomal replication initiator protein DnaA [bacterium]
MHNDLDQVNTVWNAALKLVKNKVLPSAFSLWIEPLKPVPGRESELVVEAPDGFFADWVQKHYGEVLLAACQVINPDLKQVLVRARTETGPAEPGRPAEVAPAAAPVRRPPGNGNINPLYTFDNFVIGDSNRLAHAAALSVAQSPGTAYNPLFIYGPVGVGKTHLMQAIGNHARHQAGLQVAFLSSEKFLNEFIESLQNKSTAAFRNRFREVDLLLIDDVQFLGGKEETQREFFHTFNTLYDFHKQVIVSSDRPPGEMKDIEKRLVSRFEWGLVVDIQPPDLETRVAIIKNKARLKNLDLPQEVAFCIAEKVEGNVRLLEGALNKLLACASLYEKSVVDLEFSQSILNTLFEASAVRPRMEVGRVQEFIGRHYNLKVSDLKSGRRQQSLVMPRQLAIYLARKLTGASLPQLGEAFGGKNHTTILYTCRKVEDKLGKDPDFKEEVARLEKKLKQETN